LSNVLRTVAANLAVFRSQRLFLAYLKDPEAFRQQHGAVAHEVWYSTYDDKNGDPAEYENFFVPAGYDQRG